MIAKHLSGFITADNIRENPTIWPYKWLESADNADADEYTLCVFKVPKKKETEALNAIEKLLQEEFPLK